MVESLTNSQLLVKFGFIKSSAKSKYKFDEKKGYYVSTSDEGYSGDDADEEMAEEANISWNRQYYKTGYPSTKTRYKLISESFQMSAEEMYYWMINHLRQDAGFPQMIKVTDMFSASENSAYFGQTAQRLSIQEDRASNFLRGIAEMVKTLFQIVRELRILDERLEIYEQWEKSKSADATLKGLYADFAENKGGQMQPGSVYHLSNQVGYASLPDLFFNTIIYKKEDVDKVIEGMPGFNKNVKAVLKRKLFQFIVWKEKTHAELKARRKFQIKYLRQHYTTIKTYMSWVKPYLRNIKRLSMNENQLDSPDLVASFESSVTEIEVLGIKPVPKSDYKSVVLMTYKFNTRPLMQFRQEYQQGAIHVGRGTVTMRSYGWTDHQIEMYKKMRDHEDRELLGLVDDQLKSAMEMLGDDLDNYIKEAEGKLAEEEEKEKQSKEKIDKNKLVKLDSSDSALSPFISVFKGLADIGFAFVPKSTFKKKVKPSGPKGDPGKAFKGAKTGMYMVYKNYKKSNGMLSW
ncbi:MAG: hypothetical protein ACMXX9_00100 [Candidatus Woesearchaeota archaeon]